MRMVGSPWTMKNFVNSCWHCSNRTLPSPGPTISPTLRRIRLTFRIIFHCHYETFHIQKFKINKIPSINFPSYLQTEHIYSLKILVAWQNTFCRYTMLACTVKTTEFWFWFVFKRFPKNYSHNEWSSNDVVGNHRVIEPSSVQLKRIRRSKRSQSNAFPVISAADFSIEQVDRIIHFYQVKLGRSKTQTCLVSWISTGLLLVEWDPLDRRPLRWARH